MTGIRAVVVLLIFELLQIEAVLVGAANPKPVPYQLTCGELEFGGNAYKDVFLSLYYVLITIACNFSTLQRLINTRFRRNKSTFLELNS